jgi:hypothetical protein
MSEGRALWRLAAAAYTLPKPPGLTNAELATQSTFTITITFPEGGTTLA